MGFQDPLDDMEIEVWYATLLPATRTPGLTLPGTFPTQCFSHSQGFTPSILWWPYFMRTAIQDFQH